MVLTISQRKTNLINKVYELYGDAAKLVCFNELTENRLALWYLRYDKRGKPSHGCCPEESIDRVSCVKSNPDCKAPINYSPETQKEHCDYCVSHERVEL